MVAAFVLFLVPVAAIAAGGFTDVDGDNVFKEDIEWLADAGVTKGCNPPINDKFCPEGNVTREQMAAFMHRLANSGAVDAGSIGGVDSDSLVQKADTIAVRQPTTDWVRLGNTPASTLGYYPQRLEVSTDGNIVMDLVAPLLADGSEYRLTDLTMCFGRLSPGNRFVSDVVIGGASGTVFEDHTPIVSPAASTTQWTHLQTEEASISFCISEVVSTWTSSRS